MAQPLKKSMTARAWFDNIATMSVSDFRKLIEKKKKEERGNPSAVINFMDEEKNTALHTACRSHRKELVEILLSEHADPNLLDANDFTPLVSACCEEANEDIIKLLLTVPGISVTARNVDKSTALHYFAKNYNSPASAEVFRLLIEKGAGVNDQNAAGETPLMLACFPLKPRPATARLLLQAGADPNLASNSGNNPLCWAAGWADQELISLLLEKGADPTLKDRNGKSAAEIADTNKRANIASMLKQAEQRWIRQKEFDTWMTGLGLTKYLPLFKKEEFDMSSISEIDEAVLNSLELPRGVRLTFLKARKEYLDQQVQEQKDKNKASVASSAGIPDRKTTGTLLPSTHIINYSDITIGRLLGKGFFAEVREGEYRGSPIAVKIIYRESFRNKGDIELFYQEAEILSKLRFPTVVQFIGICVGDQHCIITEFMKDGSLYQKLHDYPDDILRSHKWQLQIAVDIARGMNYLHGLNPPVLHRDLTSKNILLDGKIAKVADFGLSKEKDMAAAMTASVGALPWAAPEVFKGATFTEAADTYSYGVILWELWSGKDPQGDLAPLAFANKVAHENFRPTIAPNTPAAIKELIVRCWDADAKKRPSFDDILKYLKAYEASGHDRHSTKEKKDKDKREKRDTKRSSSKPAEPTKTSSEANLLSSYGGNPVPSSPDQERANSEANLLASYGQEPSPSPSPGIASSTDMYINSTFSSGKTQSAPSETETRDLGKSLSADQLRKHSDSEVAARAANLKSSGSSQSDGDLIGSGRLRFASADSAANAVANNGASSSNTPLPTIAVPPASPGEANPNPLSRSATAVGAAPGKLAQLQSLHRDRAFFEKSAAPKSNRSSPTHLRRVSVDEGRGPDAAKDPPKSSDSPQSKP